MVVLQTTYEQAVISMWILQSWDVEDVGGDLVRALLACEEDKAATLDD